MYGGANDDPEDVEGEHLSENLVSLSEVGHVGVRARTVLVHTLKCFCTSQNRLRRCKKHEVL